MKISAVHALSCNHKLQIKWRSGLQKTENLLKLKTKQTNERTVKNTKLSQMFKLTRTFCKYYNYYVPHIYICKKIQFSMSFYMGLYD